MDYAFVHETKDDNGNWLEVAKIDCCHSQVHKHQRHRQGRAREIRTTIRWITCQEDVEETYDESFNDIIDNYEEHLRRWERGYEGPATTYYP